MNMREQFEARFPTPAGVEWDEANKCYRCAVPHAYLALWMGWSAALEKPDQTCKIGIYGRAYDGPEVTRAYTYGHQPDNVAASKLGQACCHASKKPGGDFIDQGLGLLMYLENAGFGVFEVKS